MFERIVNATERHAKAALLAMCQDRDILVRAVNLLDELERRDGAMSNGSKRKADDEAMLICMYCEHPFTEEDNVDNACRYHEGELEIDEETEVWADHDEERFGPIDTEMNRTEFPEGFFWNCCGKHGDEEDYCMQSRHVAAPGQEQKRARYDGNGAYDEDDDGEDESGEDEADYSDTEGEEGYDGNGANSSLLARSTIPQVEIDDDDEAEGSEDEDEDDDEDNASGAPLMAGPPIPHVEIDDDGDEYEDEDEDEEEFHRAPLSSFHQTSGAI